MTLQIEPLAATEIPECRGKLFPNLEDVQWNKTTNGVVFSARLEGMGLGAKAKRIGIDQEQFQQCTRCPAYRACYDLSLATLALQTALHTRF